MRKLKIGVIGLGCIANAVHLPQILSSKDLELVAICDIDKDVLAQMKEKYDINEEYCFTDYHDLINCNDVDVVDICTPNDCHYEIALECVNSKKPYSLEKPITLTYNQAKDLEEKSLKNNVPNMICFSYRFKSAARYARDLIQSGKLGEIYHVNMQYFQAWGLEHYKTPLVWRFVKERTGSGALGDLGSHALDLVRFLTGKEYTKIIGQADTFIKNRKMIDDDKLGVVDVDDYCNYMANMGNISTTFQITRFAYGRGNYQRLEVDGSKGSLVYKLDEQPDKDELEICIGDVYDNTNNFCNVNIPDKYKCTQMQSFADIVNGKSDGYSANISDGAINQYLLDAILKSIENNNWIDL